MARTLSGPLGGARFDAVYTAEDIGSYKPAHGNFEYLFAHARADLGVDAARGELLHVARQQAKALAESGYRPPLPARQIPVAGDVGIATFRMMLVNMLEGRFISEHDMEVSLRIATVLCGGNVDRGSLVDEEWLLKLEREHFVALAKMPKTQERIAFTLKNGKPLRN